MKTFVKLVVESGAIVDGDRVPDVGEVVEINGDKVVRTTTERVVDAEEATSYVYLRAASPEEIAAYDAKVRREQMIADRSRAEAARRQAEHEDKVKRQAEATAVAAAKGKAAVASLVTGTHCIRALTGLGVFRRTHCQCGAEVDASREYAVVRGERSVCCDRCASEQAPDLAAMVEGYSKKAKARKAA